VRHKRSVLGVIAATVLASGSLLVAASSSSAVSLDEPHVTICHRTNSDTNPYVEISPAVSGVLNGHADQHNDLFVWTPTLKAQHQKWGDIIPAFDFGPGQQFSGLNLTTLGGPNGTTTGAAILANHCVIPGEVPPAPELVSLTVSKLVVGTLPSAVTGFTAEVICDENAPVEIALPKAGGAGTPASIDVEVGSHCSVVETATGGASHVSYSVAGIESGIFIDADTDVVITNTFDPPQVDPGTVVTPTDPGALAPVVSPAVVVAAAAVVASPAFTG
jgi:hypothetical protein